MRVTSRLPGGLLRVTFADPKRSLPLTRSESMVDVLSLPSG